MNLTGEPVLRVSGVRKSFTTPAGNTTVHNDTDLTIHAAETNGVNGPDGAGT